MFKWALLIRLVFPDYHVEEFRMPVGQEEECYFHAGKVLQMDPKDFGAVSIEAGCAKSPPDQES